MPRRTVGDSQGASSSLSNVVIYDASGNPVTYSSLIDSRRGMDVEHSSIAIKNIIDFYSSDAAQRLLAGGTALFSPGGTRATYYDLTGYLGAYFSFTDNSSGASGGTLYIRWSRDGVNTAYNDPGDGSGLTNFDIVSTAALTGAVFIPKKTRYVNFVFVQGASNQGSAYPQIAQMDLTLYPLFFTNSVEVTNALQDAVFVQSSASVGEAVAGNPFLVGGMDSGGLSQQVSAQTVGSLMGLVISGAATALTGTPLVTAEKLGATGTESSVTATNVSGTLLAASTSRRQVIFYNSSTTIPVFIRLSSSACTTATGGYSDIIPPGTTWPTSGGINYSGAVTCITASGSAAIAVTQVT